MYRLHLIFPLLVFICLGIFLWQGLEQNPNEIPSPLINKPLPALPTISRALFKGHLTLLNVFATWCVSCQKEHALLLRVKNSQVIEIDGLNYKDNRTQALQWLARYGNPYAHIIDDPKGILGIDLGVYGTPETFLIDSQTVIRAKFVGPITNQKWRQQILPLILKIKAEHN